MSCFFVSPLSSDFCSVAGAPLTYRHGVLEGMCFDYEKVREENRENLKEEEVIRACNGIFWRYKKCTLFCNPAAKI